MFTKSKKLLVSLMLAPLSLLLINLPADARYTWTGWQKCEYNWSGTDYTDWTARIEVRSDGAARPAQIVFGNGNTERVKTVRVLNSWVTGGNWSSDTPVYFNADGATEYTSPRFDDERMTWVTNRLRRNIDVWLTRANGDVCISTYNYNFSN